MRPYECRRRVSLEKLHVQAGYPRFPRTGAKSRVPPPSTARQSSLSTMAPIESAPFSIENRAISGVGKADTILWPASHETEQEGDHEQNDRDPEDDFGALHCGARDAPEFE